MNTKRLFIFLLFTAGVCHAYSWNKLGHDASAVIAEKYLSKKALKNMTPYLEGHTVSWLASYMDYMGYVYKLGISNEWFDHCAPVDKNFQYSNGDFGLSGKQQKGDAVMCIRKAVNEMKDGGYKHLTDSVVNLYLKWLIHFVPDIHCPSHIIYNFRPTNYQVEVGGGSKALFHSIWDAVPDTYGTHDWSSSDFCERLTFNLTKKQKVEIEMNGDILGWVNDNAKNCIVAYDIVRQDKLTSVDQYNATVLADKQLVKGGVRLAYLLNLIFGK